ncbi:formyl transferase [Henriciella sp.]|uniref:formyl transferase n=1 Tax=Henriciella sp. TaxID=1968823 RepID=UPI002601FD21|nr:formyl transferase [Henriciella sp.]
MSNPPRIVALTAGGPHSWIMINALRARFGDFPVIREEGEPAASLWRRRRRMLGPLKVASMQAARLPLKLTKRGTGSIIQEMIERYGLQPDPPQDVEVINVASVNSDACRSALQEYAPQAVFVISTRMIGRKTLSSVQAPFVNYHSGINPAYRGMFGGYFALANGEPEHFGATVHLVDEGVDTGGILYQSHLSPEPRDNFHTYLWRLAAGSREIVIQAIEDAVEGRLNPVDVDLPSQQWFAPTFGSYIWTGLSRGVW